MIKACLFASLLVASYVSAFYSVTSDGTTLFALTQNKVLKYRLSDLQPQCYVSFPETNTAYSFIPDPQGRFLFSFENTNTAAITLFKIDTSNGQKTTIFNEATKAVRSIIGADNNYVYFLYADTTDNNYSLRRQSITTSAFNDLVLTSNFNNAAFSPSNKAIFLQTESLGCKTEPPYGCSQRVVKVDLVTFTLGSSYDIAGEGAQLVSPKNELVSNAAALAMSFYAIADNQPATLIKTVDLASASTSPSFLFDQSNPDVINIGVRTNFQSGRGFARADEYSITQYDTNGNQISSALVPNSNLTDLATGGTGFGIATGVLYFYQQAPQNGETVMVAVSAFKNGITITKDLTMSQCAASSAAPSTAAPSSSSAPSTVAPSSPSTSGPSSTSTSAPSSSAAPSTPTTTTSTTASLTSTSTPVSTSSTTPAPLSGNNNARASDSSKTTFSFVGICIAAVIAVAF
jgi:hypothetical protein